MPYTRAVKKILILLGSSFLFSCGGTPEPANPNALGVTATITGKVEGYTLGAGVIKANLYAENVEVNVGTINQQGDFLITLPNVSNRIFYPWEGTGATVSEKDAGIIEAQFRIYDDNVAKVKKAALVKEDSASATMQKRFTHWYSNRNVNVSGQGFEGTKYELKMSVGWNNIIYYSSNGDGKSYKSGVYNELKWQAVK
jgi:hypothetical protein